MPDSAKQTLTTRTESHSDVATSEAAKSYQTTLTSRQFGEALLRRLRETQNGLTVRNLREEWISTEDGMVFEISAELQPIEA
jgi:hypothetical protein